MIELPQTVTTQGTFTYDVPHVLISIEDNVKTIREGGLREIARETELSYSFELPADEKLFKIVARNSFSVANATVSALNDSVVVNGVTVNSSLPSKTEYMDLVGKRVLFSRVVGIDSGLTKMNDGKAVYRIVRFYLNVP